jgi:multidrug resistance efflux pump
MGVKVRRERPDQRRHHRVTAPFYITLGGEEYRAADWSLGGFRIENVRGPLPKVGEELDLAVALPFQGFNVSFTAKARVVRNDPGRHLFACQWSELGEREAELMQHFIEELVRGAMIDVQDTIQRIDVPVTPASLDPKSKPQGGVPVRRWPVKAIVMTAIYSVIGLIIFSYAIILGYSNFYRMEVQTAVIAAPIEQIPATSDGRVSWAGKKPGDPVATGEILVNVLDNAIERDIEIAQIAVNEKRANLDFLKRRLADEVSRMASYQTVDTKNIEQVRLDIQSSEAQVLAAEQHYGRLAVLHRKGLTTDAKLEEAEKSVATLRKALESKKVEFASRQRLQGQTDGRYHYTGQTMVGEVAQLEAQVALAENETRLANDRLQALRNHQERLQARAPFEGTLLELPHVDRGTVKRGDIVAIVEQRKQRHVLAYLTQDEVLKVGLGDEVLLYVPALSETLKGRIERVDRTSGFVKEQGLAQGPGYRWRGATDRSAKVTIAFADQRRVTDVERYRAGLPTVVIFPQRTTNQLTNSLRQKITTTF